MSIGFFSGLNFGLGVATAFFIAVFVLGLFASSPKDDSDPANGRSGVKVVTDYKTGLQYLRAPGGGIVPRMTLEGEQMREGE